MKPLISLVYGLVNYLLGAAALVYLIAFVFNLYVPFSIDSGNPGKPWLAVGINLALIVLFGLQHSVMARPAFKQWLIRHIPQAVERSTYIGMTAVVTFTLCLLWQPMPTVLWEAGDTALHNALLAIGLAGWGLVFYSTFIINHFDLFGVRQVWLEFQGKQYTAPAFKIHSLYKYIRHPIMTGAFIGIWVTPVMTAGHLLFALGMSAYILIGVYHEEKDLIRFFGKRYTDYMQSTARFFPLGVKRKPVSTGSAQAE